MKDFKLMTPVVFIIFNRPQTTLRVFEEIRKAKPQKLLIIADGPREDKIGENFKCEEVRSVVENIDWDCQVLKNYSAKNLGCRNRISSGLEWAFENIDEGIILEDDCLPNQSFFRFSQEMLDKYRYDEKIMHVSGINMHVVQKDDNNEYYFSGYPHIWGWATWKRAFQYYDVTINDWPEKSKSNFLDKVIADTWYRKYVNDVMFDVYKGKVDTWCYQWSFAVWKNEGLCITPCKNLVTNIGFGKGATHTKKKNFFGNRPVYDLEFPLIHPAKIVRDLEKDGKEDIINRTDWKYKYLPYMIFKVLKEVRRILRNIF